MTLAEIRSRYGVPAFKGSKIRIVVGINKETQDATIIGSARGALKIKLDLTGDIRLCHPTFNIEYLED